MFQSIKCSECGKVFKNAELANYHAEKSGHDQFEESVEEVRRYGPYASFNRHFSSLRSNHSRRKNVKRNLKNCDRKWRKSAPKRPSKKPRRTKSTSLSDAKLVRYLLHLLPPHVTVFC